MVSWFWYNKDSVFMEKMIIPRLFFRPQPCSLVLCLLSLRWPYARILCARRGCWLHINTTSVLHWSSSLPSVWLSMHKSPCLAEYSCGSSEDQTVGRGWDGIDGMDVCFVAHCGEIIIQHYLSSLKSMVSWLGSALLTNPYLLFFISLL